MRQKPIDLSTRLAVTTTEAGRLLGISGASIRALIRAGRLKGIEYGMGRSTKSYIISVESLKAFLSGGESGGAR